MGLSLSNYNIYQQLNSCRVAASVDLGAIYYNGSLNNGIKATLTNAGSLIPLMIDGVMLNYSDRVLVFSQNNTNENGIYVLMVQGNNWVLERSTDFQCVPQLKSGQYVSIYDGTENGGKVFILENPLPQVFGNSPISFLASSSSNSPGITSWQEVSTNNFQMLPNKGYIINSPTDINIILPVSANEFDEIEIVGKGIGLYKITQTSLQKIVFGIQQTTLGSSGFIQSTNQYDSIRLISLQSNVLWSVCLGLQGNFTIN